MTAEIIMFVPKRMRVKPIDEQLCGDQIFIDPNEPPYQDPPMDEYVKSAGYPEPQYDPTKSLEIDEEALRAMLDADITHYHEGRPIGSKEPA